MVTHRAWAWSLLPLLSIGTACGDDGNPSSDSYTYCIALGTLVSTPDGTCPIESLEVGSPVLAVDPSSGEVVPTRVVAVKTAERECLSLRLVGGRSLVCTGDHPLYDPDAEQYAPATDWVDGRRSHVAMLIDGRLQRVAVAGHEQYVGVRRVFDVTVADQLHNFVANGCLVHNKSVFYCDTSYGYNEQGECVLLSSTGIADTGSDTELDTDSTGSSTGTADGGSSGASTGGSGGEAIIARQIVDADDVIEDETLVGNGGGEGHFSLLDDAAIAARDARSTPRDPTLRHGHDRGGGGADSRRCDRRGADRDGLWPRRQRA